MRSSIIAQALACVPLTAHAASTTDVLLRLNSLLVGPGRLTVQTCPSQLARWTKELDSSTATVGSDAELIRRTFAARRSVRTQLRAWIAQSSRPRRCVDQVRVTLSALRRAEDLAVLRQGRAGWIAARPVTLRSGDVLLSRGNTFVSAAIAKIGRVEGDFSHLAQVYIDAPAGTEVEIDRAATDPRGFTVEAHIEVGTFTRPFRDYVKDHNARVVQLRPRQSAADANLAGKNIFDWVRAYQVAHAGAYQRAVPTVDDNPPYDFRMDVDDIGAIFCAEVVAIAQAAVGWRVPRVQTELKQNQVTRVMGITRRTTFAPSDLEVDPRFDVLAETRELEKLPASLRKDQVMADLYARMARGAFEFTINPADRAKAMLAWIIRQNNLGFQDRLTKGMPTAIIALSFAIEREGARAEAALGH